jgi:hypothetical protein
VSADMSAAAAGYSLGHVTGGKEQIEEWTNTLCGTFLFQLSQNRVDKEASNNEFNTVQCVWKLRGSLSPFRIQS